MKFDDYQMILKRDTNGSYVAYLPAIEGCQAWGENRYSAENELFYVFEMIAEEYAASGKLLPQDVRLSFHAS